MTVDLDQDAYDVARREALAAGVDVRDWIASVIFRCSTGDLPIDDCGFYSPIPEELAAV